MVQIFVKLEILVLIFRTLQRNTPFGSCTCHQLTFQYSGFFCKFLGMVELFVKFQETNAKFRILQIFAPSSFILKKCQQIENGVKLCKIPCLCIIFQNFTKKCTICFTHTLSADILSKFLVCYGVYICKIQADKLDHILF